jgi:hypothetical protein
MKKADLQRDHTMKKILAAVALGALLLPVSLAEAQTTPSTDSAGQASPDGTSAETPPPAKTAKKTKPATHVKTAAAKSGSKPGQYATEAEAKAHCHGATIVWVDSDHFNHYAGTREYGRKPGAYACEQ